MTALIDLSGIGKTFTLPTGERLEILANLDLTVEPGEVVAIVGRSGSGKSTLLNILGLLEPPTTGTYRLDGIATGSLGDRKRARIRGERLGFIFQQFHLLDRRSALENVAEPLLYAGSAALRTRSERASDLLDAVGLAERAHSMPHLLSGGEQQRVAIARALVRSPRVVLADEPTGALDTATGERVLHLLLDLVRTNGVSLILVTHEPDIAARADRILILHNGHLIRDAVPFVGGDLPPSQETPGHSGTQPDVSARGFASDEIEDSSQARNDNHALGTISATLRTSGMGTR